MSDDKPKDEAPQQNAEKTENTQDTTDAKSGDDKFLKFTKKATEKTEQFIGTSYKKARAVASQVDPTRIVGLIDKLFAWTRSFISAERYQAITDWFARTGQTCILFAALVNIAFWVVAGLREYEGIVTLGIGASLLLVGLQYTAGKFVSAGTALIESSPTKLKSTALLDSIAVLAEIAGILVVIACVVLGGFVPIMVGVAIWALCDCVMLVALHPQLLNIEIDENTSAREEAIGVISFFFKSAVKLAPIAFGIGALFGFVTLSAETLRMVFNKTTPHMGALVTFKMMIATALPFVSYLVFALYYLIIDVLRALLSLPGKLDEIRDKQ